MHTNDPVNPGLEPRAYGRRLREVMQGGAERPAPSFDEPEVSVRGPAGWQTIVLAVDRSQQRIRLDVPEDSEALGAMASDEEPDPSFRRHVGGTFVPAAALGFKAKQFDDGLCAAVESAATKGLGRFPGRLAWLARLLRVVSDESAGEPAAAATVLAALRLGGAPTDALPAVDSACARITQEFLADPSRSKPLGFFTWSRELARAFQRDRLLQGGLTPEAAATLARAIVADSGLNADYDASLWLAARLTNPLAGADVRAILDTGSGGTSARSAGHPLLPPSQSHETWLVQQMFGGRPVPEGFDLGTELATRIQDGRLDITPSARSGWYDHQTFALEPLLRPDDMPEARHLELTATYRKELRGLFRGLLALTRETHVKQGQFVTLCAPPFDAPPEIRPRLTVEPVASYYLRRARSYRFVRDVLIEAFGADALTDVSRLTEAGPLDISLAAELRLMEGLFHGAYLTACGQIGLQPEADATLAFGDRPEAARVLFAAWATAIKDDPDLSGDVRMMVPLFYDPDRQRTKVWAVLGVSSVSLDVSFAKPPRVTGWIDAAGATHPGGEVIFEGESHDLPSLVTVEMYVSGPMNRDEFRRHCDEHRTSRAIVAALQA